jgi:hypothetical protein
MIAHTFLCVNTDVAAVREDARARLAMYPKLPFYAKMFAAAGDAEAGSGKVSDQLIDSVVIYGSESECIEKLLAFKEKARADEVIASLMVASGDRGQGLSAGLRVVSHCRPVEPLVDCSSVQG